MNTNLFSKIIITLIVSQYLVACKAPTESSSNSGASDSGSVNSGQGGEIQPTPTPSPSPTPADPGTSNNPNSGSGNSNSNSGNNPSDSTCGAPQVGLLEAGHIAINSDAKITSSLSVNLTLERAFTKAMKISNTPDCSCGTWEPVAADKTWTLAKANGVNTVSVQFKDYDGTLTLCASATIIHDNEGPKISLSADPANTYITGTNNLFNLQVSDPGAGVKSVNCTLDGQSVPCPPSQSGAITLSNLSAGDHKLAVSATDNLNQTSSSSVNFSVTSPYREITQNKSITAENKVDILVVVDNSPSMQDVQKNMAKRVSSLMNQVKDLDYRIAVTTTDPTNKTTGDGRLLPLTGFSNQYVITPAMGLANAQTALANTVQRPEIGSASEQGIYATYRVIERAMAGEVNQKNFFRSDAAFSVILISDADESATGSKNQPQNLINLVKYNWPNKKFIFNSVIVRPNDSACLNSGREAYGPIYDRLSRMLGYGTVGGSIIGTVCASDYGAQLAGIGQSVQQLVKVMDLDCAPLGSTTASVVVLKDGTNYTDAYEIQGLKIVFQNNLPAGNYTLSYKCQ